jgi:hypothetical protein
VKRRLALVFVAGVAVGMAAIVGLSLLAALYAAEPHYR